MEGGDVGKNKAEHEHRVQGYVGGERDTHEDHRTNHRDCPSPF